jgi:1,2-dihydroxy-3-keto-5-methylthiopentene dioxygenase
MAVVTIPEEHRTITDLTEITQYLQSAGIDYEQWQAAPSMSVDASADEILAAHAVQINDLKARGGYKAADVIDVGPKTVGLEAMLARFNIEHTHDEDEVRYVVAGRGLFHIHVPGKPVFAIEVVAGDLIRVPRGTLHWFNLCSDQRIRTIRLFQDTAGWTPHYTGSGEDRKYEPVCFGPAYIPYLPNAV